MAAHNRGKPREQQTLLSVDGVHGLGIENVTIPDLGADFFPGRREALVPIDGLIAPAPLLDDGGR